MLCGWLLLLLIVCSSRLWKRNEIRVLFMAGVLPLISSFERDVKKMFCSEPILWIAFCATPLNSWSDLEYNSQFRLFPLKAPADGGTWGVFELCPSALTYKRSVENRSSSSNTQLKTKEINTSPTRLDLKYSRLICSGDLGEAIWKLIDLNDTQTHRRH